MVGTRLPPDVASNRALVGTSVAPSAGKLQYTSRSGAAPEAAARRVAPAADASTAAASNVLRQRPQRWIVVAILAEASTAHHRGNSVLATGVCASEVDASAQVESQLIHPHVGGDRFLHETGPVQREPDAS